MSSNKSRLSITLPDEVRLAISMLASRNNISIATKAEILLEVALELEDDEIWNDIASQRDRSDIKFLTHDQVLKAYNTL